MPCDAMKETNKMMENLPAGCKQDARPTAAHLTSQSFSSLTCRHGVKMYQPQSRN